MTAAYFEDHPTDPEKVILRKKPHLDKGRDYEEGFIDGMQYQMQSSVDKAVNRMAQPEQERVEWGVDWNKDGSCVSIIKRTPGGGIEVVAVEYGPPRPWVNMTADEVDQGLLKTNYAMKTAEAWRHGVEWAQFNLMRKNT